MGALHGVNTIRKIIGGQVITIVKSGVIMLVGIAPKGRTQTLVEVVTDAQASEFGSPLDNFTIPQALALAVAKGIGPVLVNNVYDPATNDLAVTAESHTVAERKVKTTYHPTTAVVVKHTSGTPVYVKDTDYKIDDYGNITILVSSIANGAVLKLDYSYYDPTTMTANQIIGGISGDTRTGIKLFDLAKTTFGYAGKLLIAPGFSSLTAVATAMEAYVELPAKRGITYIDAPSGTSKSTAITGRGDAGTINFKSRSKRVYLLFPEGKGFSGENVAINVPLSAYYAVTQSYVDKTEGYHVSVSNHLVQNLFGSSMPITDDINDENSDANLLNQAGIATLSTSDGVRTWGNRSASFFQETGNTAIDSFISVVRTADIIEESIEMASRKYVDKPINNALIDSIREDVNAFLRGQVALGAINDGICYFDKAKNPDVDLAAGKIKMSYNFLPPPPCEQITYESFIDITMFTKLG